MKKTFTLFLLSALFALLSPAQTLEQAKEWYKEGNYAEAKPVFQKYVKQQPSNGSYNLWYGVTLLRTGEADASIRYLKVAVNKRVASGQLYLAQAYHATHRFDEAVETLQDYIADLTKRKRSTALADSLLVHSRLGAKMLRGVEQVMVIDSLVMDKDDLLSAYFLSSEAGRLFPQVIAQSDTTQTWTAVYETEMGNKRYFAEPTDEGNRLVSVDKTSEGWSSPRPLSGLDEWTTDAAFPYVMADGITAYFSARSSDNSLGGYDLFVSQFSTSAGRYLSPENLGLPFNSPYNDYMLVIDEYSDIGWFASDRFQPEGKVCVYVFVPNATKRVLSYEDTPKGQLRSLSRLNAIADTWTDGEPDPDAMQRLAHLRETPQAEGEGQRVEFTFVINDAHIYHQLTDFRSADALFAFQTLQELHQTYRQACENLSALRHQYATADETTRRQLTPGILDTEEQLLQMGQAADTLELTIRRLEIAALSL